MSGRISIRRRASALMIGVVGLLLVVAPVKAAAGVINFDDLVTGGPNGSGGALVTVNSQYASQGVTFDNVTAFDYSKGIFRIPGFAHSGTVAVEQCFATEFCQTPIAATFTTGQSRVGVWVGYSAQLSVAQTVRLTALNAASAVVGFADTTIQASSGPTPIRTHLVVNDPGATITQLQVGVPNGYNNFIAVDDVEFSSTGPPPPCNATSPPTVTIALPTSGLVVQNNEFTLQGAVTSTGALVDNASISAVGATTSTSSLYPRLIGPTGGGFGPIRFNGLLVPGTNQLTLSATNCRGTGTSVPVEVTYNPIPASARFKLLAIEVTQTIQDPVNQVTLIASSSAGVKRTFARAYLTLNGASQITRVTGRLYARRPDGSLPGGPTGVDSLNAVTVPAGATLDSARASLATSLNFELPAEWLTAGQLHLTISLAVENATSNVPCDNCDNHEAVGPSSIVTFHQVPPVRIWIVSVPYHIPPDMTTVFQPRQTDIDHLASWLRRAYPTANVEVHQDSMPVQDRAPTNCHDLNTGLAQWAGSRATDNPDAHFYGLVSDNNNNNFMRGCSVIGGQFGSGPAGAGTFGWDFDGSYADWYGGHEIGHQYGRLHPGYCNGNSLDDHHYPFVGGLIGSPVFPFQGFDAGDAALSLPMALNDWSGSTDVMTYCNHEWMSSYTYEGILANLCSRDRPDCPDAALLTGTAVSFAGTRRPTFAGAAPASERRRPRQVRVGLEIVGTLRPATGAVTLASLATLTDTTLTVRPRSSRYAIELRGAGGVRLARYPFAPGLESDAPSKRLPLDLIHEVVPFNQAARLVVVVHGTTILARVAVAAHAPTVRLLFPDGGQRLGRRVTVRWASPGGRRTVYELLYSPNGTNFTPVATTLRRTSFTVDLTRLAGGKHARFRVLATNGVRTGLDTSDHGFSVPVKPPRVVILTPTTHATVTAGQELTLIGSAQDLQDGQLSRSLMWRSSIQGLLGRGLAITVALKPGLHRINLIATDRARKTTVATIIITVTALPPVIAAHPT